MSWLPSCSAHMDTLHINAISAASQAKQTICKADIRVIEGRRAQDCCLHHAKSEQAGSTNH